MTEIACIAALGNQLGEGPFWDARANRLYWFDIRAAKLFALQQPAAEVRTWSLASRASAGAPIAGRGDLLISAEDGVWRFDPDNGQRVQADAAPHLTTGFRSNDGKADQDGGLWWSSMDDNGGKQPGAVYRFDGTESHRMIPDVHIANSLAFSADGRTVYVSDSAVRTIWRFAFDPEAHTATERQVFAQVADADPDGAAMDAEGHLWVAMWGGGRVDRFAPDGRVVQSLAMPVSQPTACAFGGEGLDTLYITSALDGLSDVQRSAQPLAGALFAAKPGVAGLAIPPVRAEP